jgi:ATP-dependent RNA helicase DHX36
LKQKELSDAALPFLQGQKDDRSMETETWYDLALLYLSLSQWSNAELCVSKIKSINAYSPLAYHATGASFFPPTSLALRILALF